jgi:hypothetical protein
MYRAFEIVNLLDENPEVSTRDPEPSKSRQADHEALT